MRFPLPLGRRVPDPLRSAGIQVLCNTFAQVFRVKAPDVARLPAEVALRAFREFSAACMEEAMASPAYAASRREELERRARRLGSRVRAVLHPNDAELPQLVRALYAAIDIDVIAQASGAFTFNRCSFAGRYTPGLCAFMSAFDSGFVGGLCDAGQLRFETRITQGAPACRAQLSAAPFSQAAAAGEAMRDLQAAPAAKGRSGEGAPASRGGASGAASRGGAFGAASRGGAFGAASRGGASGAASRGGASGADETMGIHEEGDTG